MRTKTGILELEGMEFRAFHGCLEHEKLAGNLFIVDFKGRLPMDKACESDALEDALDYGRIYDCIAAQMKIHSDLLEHLTAKIIDALAASFPEFEEFEVRVSKQRPPVDGICRWSRITLNWHA